VNAVSSSTTAKREALRAPPQSLSDRLVAAIPLLGVYTWLCVVYLVEAWTRSTPWLFGDELELTQLSRSIAATGHPARRGQAHSYESLYTVVTAPLWLIHEVGAAYAAIKYADVLVMAAVVFPTYFLARLMVGRGWALFAAAAAGAVPALAYSSYLVEEPLAYPFSALCIFLIVKALVTRQKGWIAVAVVASGVAQAVRGELVVLLVVLLLGTVLAVWSSPWARTRRVTWTLGDHVGLLTLVAGAVFVLSGVASTHSRQWYVTTYAYQNRMFTMTMWAAAAFAIGIGILPMIAGLASLIRPRGEPATTETRVFRGVFLAAIVGFGMYTAVKAAYISTVFATRVEERNLIYLAPLFFVGTALVLERRRAHPLAFLAAAAYTLYLVLDAGYHAVGSSYEMGIKLYSDALGFSILQAANRYLSLSIGEARPALIGICVVAVLLLAAPAVRPLRRRPKALGAIAAAAAAATIGWNLTGELGAASATISSSRAAAATLKQPFSWVDDATKRHATIYFGAGEADPTPENLLEFWNRSIKQVTSLDGTVGGPGPAGGPDIARGGLLSWNGVTGEFDYAVEDRPCVQLAGTVVATHPYRGGGGTLHWWLVHLERPNRLVSLCMGLYEDGWSGEHDSQYFRFSGGAGGRMRVVVSRVNAAHAGPSPVHVIVSRLIIDTNAYPEARHVTQQINGTISGGQTHVYSVRAPAASFVVQVVVDDKFVPGNGDERMLGAQVSYAFVPRPG
jgi:hypothetical protein